MLHSSKYILAVITTLLTINYSFGQLQLRDTVTHLNPPFQGFYSKYLNSDGIPIRSSEMVSDSALQIASGKLAMTLKDIPVVRKNLIANGVELHIIGKDQQTSDLPEFKDRKGVQYTDNGILTDIDKRTRGMGGLYASCGEENLLHLPSDLYGSGYDICMHEFAHTIMSFGLDSALNNQIVVQYTRAISDGLWKGAYAATNNQEYWAELTTWYFGAHGDMLPGKQPSPGPNSLRAYDPGGYELIDRIFTGKLPSSPVIKKSRIVFSGAKSGNSAQKSKLLITNNSNKVLKISWIDQQGNINFIKDVQPSSTFENDTFYSYVWVIDNGQAPTYLQVFDPICSIVLTKNY